MVHVDDVPRGLMCNCSCPNCYEKLMAQHGNVREGCHQPVSFLVHVSWYWSFIPLVLEYFIAETALEANIQLALNSSSLIPQHYYKYDFLLSNKKLLRILPCQIFHLSQCCNSKQVYIVTRHGKGINKISKTHTFWRYFFNHGAI